MAKLGTPLPTGESSLRLHTPKKLSREDDLKTCTYVTVAESLPSSFSHNIITTYIPVGSGQGGGTRTYCMLFAVSAQQLCPPLLTPLSS